VTAVVSIRLVNPMFGSADTIRLANPEVEGIVNRAVGEGIYAFLEGNPAVARVERLASVARNLNAARSTVPTK
jgi:DNA gyrase/topoisomerase IV subunit B